MKEIVLICPTCNSENHEWVSVLGCSKCNPMSLYPSGAEAGQTVSRVAPAGDGSSPSKAPYQLAEEICNLAHLAWLDKGNAEFLFREIERKADLIKKDLAAQGAPGTRKAAIDNTISITIRGQEQVAIVMDALQKAGFVTRQAQALTQPGASLPTAEKKSESQG